MEQNSEGRKVIIHQTIDGDGDPLFCSNTISTTKYSFWTFIFQNLFEQFSRIANFYFLICALFLYIFKSWAPLDGTSAIVPLLMVLVISGAREAVEDFLRYLSDKDINHSETHVLRDGGFKTLQWDQVLVGDVIRLEKNEQIPADIVMLSTSEPDGVAYVDTCNLDGETNLKVKQSLPQTKGIVDAESASSFSNMIVCDEPNNMLYTFNGYFEIDENLVPLDNKQVLLRGCVLRNTQWVIGVVVYTGLETKLMMNSSAARIKVSSMERGLNKKLVSVFALMIFLGLLGAIIGAIIESKSTGGGAWYMFNGWNRGTSESILGLFIGHIILISAMVPISLYVTLEVVRVFQAMFVHWDAGMYHIETNTSANSRTTNLSEDLGNVQYIFSDKTGTLTRNVMEFMKCSIYGRKFGSGITEVAYAAAKRRGIECEPPDQVGKAFKDDHFLELLRQGDQPEISHFMWMLSTCHSVIPEPDPKKPYGIAFQASSPDEGALVLAAADFGYVFKARKPGQITIDRGTFEVNVDVLAVLEFTSERKRSSVIIRNPETSEIVLYCKGADDLIMSRLSPQSANREVTSQHLKDFAADGLRTLCAAYKIIDEEFFTAWFEKYNEACCAIDGREEAIDQVANEIECDLNLLGATAIEDKLQIGVPEAIESLIKAGINVWVITGDKRETAINIGFACSLLSSDMTLVVLDSSDPQEIVQNIERGLTIEGKIGLVASGSSLYHALLEENQDLFFKLANRCQSVICCRVSPLQKANVVSMVRERTGALTLAIGDGANDVGMILKADIGVGISGQEGRQAVMAADYSFAQFRYLKRLLLLHGRLSFMRNIELINYSFYKNMVFTFCQILYGFFCGFSSTTIFDSMLYSIFNVIFTSAPPVVFSCVERDVSIKRCIEDPELYKWDNRKQWMTSYGNFWLSLGIGILHAFVSFFVPYFGMYPFVDGNGHGFGLSSFGGTVYGCVIFVVTFKIASMSSYWTWMHHFFIWCSALIYPLILWLFDITGLTPELDGVTIPLLKSSIFYFSIAGATVLGTIPILAINTYWNSQDTLTNRILVEERGNRFLGFSKPKKEEKSDSNKEIILDISNNDQKSYPDDGNPTGYAFEPPAASYQTVSFENRPKVFFTADQIKSRIRTTQVSTFGLDML